MASQISISIPCCGNRVWLQGSTRTSLSSRATTVTATVNTRPNTRRSPILGRATCWPRRPTRVHQCRLCGRRSSSQHRGAGCADKPSVHPRRVHAPPVSNTQEMRMRTRIPDVLRRGKRFLHLCCAALRRNKPKQARPCTPSSMLRGLFFSYVLDAVTGDSLSCNTQYIMTCAGGMERALPKARHPGRCGKSPRARQRGWIRRVSSYEVRSRIPPKAHRSVGPPARNFTFRTRGNSGRWGRSCLGSTLATQTYPYSCLTYPYSCLEHIGAV